MHFVITDAERYAAAIAAFDAANAADPNRDEGQPKELLYARRMSAMLERFAPDATETTRLAVRAQHIERWKTPRSSYPPGRTGYLQWRSGLYRYHAETAVRILTEVGYDVATIAQVRNAIAKKGLKVHAEAQLLEDIAALVFLEHYLAGFAVNHPEYDDEKWDNIIRKTWRKMSAAAQAFVRDGKVQLPAPFAPLIRKSIV